MTTNTWYNEIYNGKDVFGYESRERMYNSYIKSLIRVSGLKRGSTVLDVGCGQGFFAHLFNRHGMSVCGIDISETGIQFAQKKYAAPGIEFMIGDVLSSPVRKFDGVFARSCSLYNTDDFPRRHAVTEKIMAHVKEGGLFMFVYNSNFNRSKKNGAWRCHSIENVREHFSRYPEKRVYFINRLDTLLFERYAFNQLFSRINILISKILNVGGDIVCIVKKTKSIR